MRIGVMGGMFDPVHQGHIKSALLAREAFALDRVLMVPCGSPVHRDSAYASGEDRVAMLSLAVQSLRGLAVDDRECLSQTSSYMFNTLSAIKAENPGKPLYFISGVDSFNTLPTWYRWRELFNLVHLLIIKRPGWELDVPEELKQELIQRQVKSYDEMNQFVVGKILIQSLEPIAISSSEIRTRLKNKKSLTGLLPEAVINYINTSNVYEATGV